MKSLTFAIQLGSAWPSNRQEFYFVRAVTSLQGEGCGTCKLLVSAVQAFNILHDNFNKFNVSVQKDEPNKQVFKSYFQLTFNMTKASFQAGQWEVRSFPCPKASSSPDLSYVIKLPFLDVNLAKQLLAFYINYKHVRVQNKLDKMHEGKERVAFALFLARCLCLPVRALLSFQLL